jgi:DNA-binding transcriptional ArsR family regulator
MGRDPFARQRSTKLSNRRKVLTTIRDKPSTFGELLEKTGLSRPILSGYLKELENYGVIAVVSRRLVKGRRLEYQLTDHGKNTERLRAGFLTDYFQIIRDLVKDYPTAKMVFELARAAKKDPQLVEEGLKRAMDFLSVFDQWFEMQLKEHGLKPQDWAAFVKSLPSKPEISKVDSDETLTPVDEILNSFREALAKSVTKTNRVEE